MNPPRVRTKVHTVATGEQILTPRRLCAACRWEIGAPGFEPGTFWSQTRRATGLRYAPLVRVSNLTRPPLPPNGAMSRVARLCGRRRRAIPYARISPTGIRNGSSVLADGHGCIRRRPGGRRLVGRRLHGRGHAARRAPAGDGDPNHHVSVARHAPAAGTSARVVLYVRADPDPRRAHGADLCLTARASSGDRADRSGDASEGASPVLTDCTG